MIIFLGSIVFVTDLLPLGGLGVHIELAMLPILDDNDDLRSFRAVGDCYNARLSAIRAKTEQV